MFDALQYDSHPRGFRFQATSVQNQLLTVPASSNEVRVSHARVFGRPALPSRSEAATVLDPVSSLVRDGGKHQPTFRKTDRQTNVGAFRSIVEENKKKIGQRYPCSAGEGKDSGGAKKSGVRPTGKHSRIDPRQGTSQFDPRVDGSCKFGGSSKIGVGQFSTTIAQCGSNLRTCV